MGLRSHSAKQTLGKAAQLFLSGEIAAIEKKLLEQPDLFAYWSEHVPMNLRAIENGRN
jgi:hypothetical protein